MGVTPAIQFHGVDPIVHPVRLDPPRHGDCGHLSGVRSGLSGDCNWEPGA